VEGDKSFHIHWKPREIKQVLTLKPNKEQFWGEDDKHICELSVKVIENSLRIGHTGNINFKLTLILKKIIKK